MRLLIVTGLGYPPVNHGGAETSLDQLARASIARGHQAAAVALDASRLGRLARKLIPDLEVDRRHPYPLIRAAGVSQARAHVAERLRRDRPDVVLCCNVRDPALLRLAVASGARVLIWVPDVGFRTYIDWVPRGAVIAASSRFVAERLREQAALTAHVLYPLIDLDAYRASRRRPEHILFLNPWRTKGTELVLATAALLPRRRFEIVDSPVLPAADRRLLHRGAAALRNVTLSPPVDDPRQLYARCALLLCPSRIDDASPRVILEAHVNGIPVLASRAGGIPEVLGDGGVLLPREAPPAEWAARIEAILADPTPLAERARANAARREFAPANVLERFLELAGDVAAREAA